MIIDTDMLIWYMRGNERAYQLIEKLTEQKSRRSILRSRRKQIYDLVGGAS